MQRRTWTLRLGRTLAAPLFILLALGGLTRLLFAAAQQTRVDSIYWTDEIDSRPILGNIRRANVDGSGQALLVKGQRDSFGIALDVSGGKMYWTDEDGGDIRSANPDGTGQKVLRHSLDNPVGIALDISARKMYWTDQRAIQSANFDGTGAVKTLVSGLERPLGIALDLPGGKMYWADFSANDIERSNLDGSGRERLVTTQSLPHDVALDLTHGKMYWTSAGSINANIGRISRANLDGSDQEILLDGLSRPAGIALDVAGGKMYWADSHYDLQGQGDIDVANLDGTGRQTILKGLNVPGYIALQRMNVSPMIAAPVLLSLPWFHQGACARSKVQKIESLLRAARSRGQFNGSVLVGEKGRIIYRKAFGYADFDKKTPLRTDSAFELASVSKPFTALAIMMLEERGKLSYDDQLTKYFPDLPYQGVTIRHMLTHTAGLPEPEPLFGSECPSDKTVTTADFVARLAQRKPPAFFAPGDSWKYDRTAYFLLARIVETVSETSYAQFLKLNVFDPLGMKNSLVYHTQRMGKIANLARGYIHPSLWSDAYVLPETLPRYRYSIYWGDAVGPMGVYSSVEDLFKWVQALNHGKLVTKKTLKQAYSPIKLNDGSTPGAGEGAGNGVPSHYGYGWFIEEGVDGKTVRHTGDWRGYITCLIHNLTKDQTIIVLTNASDYSTLSIANGIENILNGRPYELPKMSIGRVIGKTLFTSGIEAAISQYRELKKSQPDNYNFKNEDELNTLGYQLLRRGDRKAAIEIFKLNVETFPDSWNVYDSLGEAYLADGNKELSIASYRRSNELKPKGRSGANH